MQDNHVLPLAREKATADTRRNITVTRQRLIGFRAVAVLIALPFIIYGVQFRSNSITNMLSYYFNSKASDAHDEHGYGRRPPYGKAAEKIFL